MTTRLRPLVALLLLTGLLAGCSSVVSGQGDGSSTAPTTASSTVRSTSSAATSGAGTATPSQTSTGTPAAAPTGTPTREPSSSADIQATAAPCQSSVRDSVVQCLRRNLSDFWSGRINDTIDEPVTIEASASQVPAGCRPGLAGPAITCRTNLHLYINKPMLDVLQHFRSNADLTYAYASIQSHEFGHVLQYTLHQPEVEQANPSDATARVIEQQADCLSGVWAHNTMNAAQRGRFRIDALELISLVSSNPEIATHGTPDQRAAALDRGLSGGRPQSCTLVTFG